VALGAIVIYAAIRLIDLSAFRRLLAFRRGELVIALFACAGVLVFNILYGVRIRPGRRGRRSTVPWCGEWSQRCGAPGPASYCGAALYWW
jgi:hypothetical protein